MEKPTKVVGRRVAAFVVDAVILTAFNLALFFVFADKRSDIEAGVAPGQEQAVYVNLTLGGDEYSIEGSGKALLFLFLVTLAGFLYYALLQGIKGWTPGKLALGIRTVDEQGRTGPGVAKGTIRWGLLIVDSFPWCIPYLVAFILALVTERNQRVGDMVAKTFVVREDAVGRPPLGPAALAGGYGEAQFGHLHPAAPPQQAAGHEAGWHPDPYGQARLRWWDGSDWTDHTSR